MLHRSTSAFRTTVRATGWLLVASVVGAALAHGSSAAQAGWPDALVSLEIDVLGLSDEGRPLARSIDAARILAEHGDARVAVDILLEGLEDAPPPPLLRAIARSLAMRADPRAVRPLREVLASEEDAAPPEVIDALGAIATPEALEGLVDALGNDALAPRARAGLVRVGSKAVGRLLEALEDDARLQRVVGVLGDIGDRRAVPPLLALLEAPPLPSASSQQRMRLAIAIVQALADIGDARAGSAILNLLDGPAAELARAAQNALPHVVGPEHRLALTRRLERAREPFMRATLLHALTAADPVRAAPRLRRLVGGAEPSRARFAVQLAVDHAHPAMASVLARAIERGQSPQFAAGALARLGEAGLEALLTLVSADERRRGPLARAIAIALRAERGRAGAAWVERAEAQLARLADSERKLVLRALSRDARVVPGLLAALRSPSASWRASAAYGCELLGDRELADEVIAQLLVERDAEAFRRLAQAAVALGARAPLPPLLRRARDPATAPEAMLLAARSVRGARARERRELGRTLRRQLRGPSAALRVQAAAALALGWTGDARAEAPLVAALDTVADPVRRAAGRGLVALGVASARERLRRHLRVEHDPWLQRLLASPPPGEGGTLELRIVTGRPRERPLVDVLLPDGRWLRLRTLPGGELVVPGVGTGGTVDVRIVPASG